MPYKDRMKQRESVKRAVERHRVLQKGITREGITEENVHRDVIPAVEMVPASYIPTTRGEVEFLPERPRYMDLGDGQTLDRVKLPKATGTKEGMLRANEVSSSVIDKERAERWRSGTDVHSPVVAGVVENRRKLERICAALKRRGLEDEVRYGIYGPTFKVVGDWLDATD